MTATIVKEATSGPESRQDADHIHEWVVYSTALTERWLMLQCVRCGLHGTVEDPSAKEWSEAYSAPSRPYRWPDAERVTQKGIGAVCVMRAGAGKKCECYSRFGVLEPGQYERVPGEVTERSTPLTDAERHELDELAKFVAESDLCSAFFPLFVRSFQEDTGLRCSQPVNQIARRVEAIDRKGLHCSPSVVARVLREYAHG
jgi:hypothetical protein